MADADVIVVGGGIAGLGAALALQDRGLRPLVLEAGGRVGGRMTTDRVGGFAIDTGVTLLGNRMRRMRTLARRLDLGPAPVRFSLALRDGERTRRYRAQRVDDLLLDGALSAAARRAAIRLLWAMVRAGRGMRHGESARAERLDDQTVGDFFRGLGPGGDELLERVLAPGLRAALGGEPRRASRLVLMQVVWNTLGAGFWNLAGGVDRLPEAIAAQVPVRLSAPVHAVRARAGGVEVELAGPGARTLTARAAILAVPGPRVPALLPEAADWLTEPAARAEFSRVASVHLGLGRPPDARDAGVGFAQGGEEGVGVLELEHLRAPGRCPPGKGMVSVYFADGPSFRCLELDDAQLEARARRTLEKTFPESVASVEIAHVIRWPLGIAQFPPGRLREMAALRRRLADSAGPIDLAGDWLDGIASESALQTGEQAARRVAARVSVPSRSRSRARRRLLDCVPS